MTTMPIITISKIIENMNADELYKVHVELELTDEMEEVDSEDDQKQRLIAVSMDEENGIVFDVSETYCSVRETVTTKMTEEFKANLVHMPEIAYSKINKIMEPIKYAISWFVDGMRKEQIYVDYEYQRNYIWVSKEQVSLIETILLNMPIQEIYLKEHEKDGMTKYAIVDGQQRLTTILRFINNEFALKKTGLEYTYPIPNKHVSESEYVFPSYVGKFFKDLPLELQNRIMNFKIVSRVIESSVTNEEVKKIFLRINSTVSSSLKSTEIRHAKYSGSINTIIENIGKLPFWNKVFAEKFINRYGHHDFIAKLILLKLEKFDNGAEITTNAKDIERLYEIYDEDTDTDKDLKVTTYITWAIGFIEPLMDDDKIKLLFGKVTHLYSLFSVMFAIKKLRKTPKDMESKMTWLISEYHRTDIEDIEDITKYDSDVRSYKKHIQMKTVNRKENKDARHQALYQIIHTKKIEMMNGTETN